MQVGTIIKSFDFPGNVECYMIGSVTSIDNDTITCDTIKHVFCGKEETITEFNKQFRTVKQGLMFGDAMFQRVVEIG